MSAPPDLLIDLGHSRIKWAKGRAGRLLDGSAGACPIHDIDRLEPMLAASPAKRALVSGQTNPEVFEAVSAKLALAGVSLQSVSTGNPALPVQPAYPQLGCDRWLALQHPWLERREGLCVIDCGTAITVDLVDDSGQHRGGWIMAGLASLRHGLLSKARRLPAPASDDLNLGSPATDSAQAIAAGTLLQALGGIDQALDRCEGVLGRTLVPYLGGGDAATLAAHIGRPVRRDDTLVLRGLALAAEAA